MGFAVKNTTLARGLDLFCPYSCCLCGWVGAPLCGCCKNYSTFQLPNFCPSCFSKTEYKCGDCDLPFAAHFVCGWREELLGQLVEEYKFDAARDYAGLLAEVLATKIPVLLGDIVIVPLPTIARHIRERGFDHTLRLAERLGKLRGWPVVPLLTRARNTVQVGTSRERRLAQAEHAYALSPNRAVEPGKTYLLLDDVWTTGASMVAAAELLQKAGAENLMMAVLVVSGKPPSLGEK